MSILRAVVVNYNGGDMVAASLRSVLAAWPAEELDLVMIDNGSTDGSLERVEAELPEVRVVRSPGNLGYPAINQATNDLSGVDLVAIVNPDVVLEPACLKALSGALEADSELGAACPRILLEGEFREVQLSVDGLPGTLVDLVEVEGPRWHLAGKPVRRRWRGGVAWSFGDGAVLRVEGDAVRLKLQGHRTTCVVLGSNGERTPIALGREARWMEIALAGERQTIVQNAGTSIGPHGLGINRGFHHPDGAGFDQPADVAAWCGAAVLLRSSYLEDVGELDSRWFLYYEDLDLSWRGLIKGWRYRYVPEAVAVHAHSSTIVHGSALYDFHHERNRILTVTKNAPAGEVAATWLDALRLILWQIRADVLGRLKVRRAPETELTRRRVQALLSALRLAPGVLLDRRRVRGSRRVADDHLPILRWEES